MSPSGARRLEGTAGLLQRDLRTVAVSPAAVGEIERPAIAHHQIGPEGEVREIRNQGLGPGHIHRHHGDVMEVTAAERELAGDIETDRHADGRDVGAWRQFADEAEDLAIEAYTVEDVIESLRDDNYVADSIDAEATDCERE